MTIEAVRPSEYINDAPLSYGEQLLFDREQISHELGIRSVALADAHKAYHECVNDMIKINTAIFDAGLNHEAQDRMRQVSRAALTLVEDDE